MENTEDEYISAPDLGGDLLGAIVFVDPDKREAFLERHPDSKALLREVFRVTNLSDKTVSVIHGRDVHRGIDPDFFLTRNPKYEPY